MSRKRERTFDSPDEDTFDRISAMGVRQHQTGSEQDFQAPSAIWGAVVHARTDKQDPPYLPIDEFSEFFISEFRALDELYRMKQMPPDERAMYIPRMSYTVDRRTLDVAIHKLIIWLRATARAMERSRERHRNYSSICELMAISQLLEDIVSYPNWSMDIDKRTGRAVLMKYAFNIAMDRTTGVFLNGAFEEDVEFALQFGRLFVEYQHLCQRVPIPRESAWQNYKELLENIKWGHSAVAVLTGPRLVIPRVLPTHTERSFGGRWYGDSTFPNISRGALDYV